MLADCGTSNKQRIEATLTAQKRKAGDMKTSNLYTQKDIKSACSKLPNCRLATSKRVRVQHFERYKGCKSVTYRMLTWA